MALVCARQLCSSRTPCSKQGVAEPSSSRSDLCIGRPVLLISCSGGFGGWVQASLVCVLGTCVGIEWFGARAADSTPSGRNSQQRLGSSPARGSQACLRLRSVSPILQHSMRTSMTQRKRWSEPCRGSNSTVQYKPCCGPWVGAVVKVHWECHRARSGKPDLHAAQASLLNDELVRVIFFKDLP